MIKVTYKPGLCLKRPWQVELDGKVIERFATRDEAEMASEMVSWYGV